VPLPYAPQNGAVLKEGDWCSINGTTGEVVKGQQPVKKPGVTGDLATFMKWVDAKRRLRVLTNADTPEDAKVRSFCECRLDTPALMACCLVACGVLLCMPGLIELDTLVALL
jgi:hypothetical protein